MSKIYCHNKLCRYCKLDKSPYNNYGICSKKEVFMVLLDEEAAEVSGHKVGCMYSHQAPDYQYKEDLK